MLHCDMQACIDIKESFECSLYGWRWPGRFGILGRETEVNFSGKIIHRKLDLKVGIILSIIQTKNVKDSYIMNIRSTNLTGRGDREHTFPGEEEEILGAGSVRQCFD